MSLFTSLNKIQYAADGTTVSFPFPYLVYYSTDMLVLGVDSATGQTTTYILNTDYTIDPSLLGQQGGINIVFGSAPAATVALTILRIVPYVQPVVLVTAAPLPSLPVMREMDYIVMMIQQLAEELARIPQLPVTDPTLQLPPGTLGFDYYPYDVSLGTEPRLSLTPGNTRDSTAGVTWIPAMGGTPITTLPAPYIVPGSADTVLFLKYDIDPATGFISDAPVPMTGTSIPVDTNIAAYQKVQGMIVTVSPIASILFTGGGLRGSQNYFYCGGLPATDGSGHLFNS